MVEILIVQIAGFLLGFGIGILSTSILCKMLANHQTLLARLMACASAIILLPYFPGFEMGFELIFSAVFAFVVVHFYGKHVI